MGRGKVDEGRAAGGLRWLGAVVVKRQPIGQSELARIWEMRETVTAYDAAYLAVTERVQADTGGRAAFVTPDAEWAGTLSPDDLRELDDALRLHLSL